MKADRPPICVFQLLCMSVIWSDRYPPEKLVSARTEWTHEYTELAAGLSVILGSEWVIEHVGSTSVPGLAAKPVIDIAVKQPRSVSAGSLGELFTTAGWTPPQQLGDHTASFFLTGGTRRAVAHIYTEEQWPEAHVRLFAAWLRDHPSDRDRYEALKIELVRAGAWEDGRYTTAKGAFVLEIVNMAREAQRLPHLTEPL